ncbi:mannose-1-phosphate guanylyltransferase/mannose-6-phosphate isomerase [Salmonella enterica subsp. enterica serovar Alachua]|nr:mannose-1-phosphate guanylyltransferase/mannose-6-phosphate isomerase [Salmonella enterica subsp. enterica serovar Adelaide]EAR9407672.1 mannose-1-phosphate guanylyltransferase/mannose-6-phosphate isomerase [Salmonella enterica]EBG0233842.1 mannose-1-phosphate guanylyltransferase/mannose-6-phosphate isomerase [Salmonella enterica subsp. enterica serovar Monschaui]ECT2879979.1 mannose-1-phosphate guanylyltransferase/mannose-6-phosphate isomerase [Salmonella enterica subsp. enterica serovar Ala
MAGGTGSRLWPLSRVLYPKQFLNLVGNSTMLQTTIARLNGIKCENPIVICNEDHRFIVAEQLRQIDKLTKNIILEPKGRNTAPAIALAAFIAQKKKPKDDPLLLVLAADHSINNEQAFREAIIKAIPYADAGKLVMFGIIPSVAHTGYGYIKRSVPVDADKDSTAYYVANFVEKPNIQKAQEYIMSEGYYWNSGMFLFRASKYLGELKKFRPDIYNKCESATATANIDMDFVRINETEFINCPEESIDYAVMEKTKDAVVLPIDVGWSDVGSWSSLWDISQKDVHGNVCQGDVINHDSEDSFIYSESSLVATVGVSNLVIVQTKDAVLVADRDKVQNVKNIVDSLKQGGRAEYYMHREVFRPWGKYDAIDQGDRYKVKKIIVKPGEGLDLRMHHHRAEHWIVVSGTAKVSLGNKIKLLVPNESIYIPQGAEYSLENPGVIPLHLIEVSSGDYLESDDIVRFTDRYNSKKFLK